MRSPLVHIGIVSRNSIHNLPRCLASVRSQSYPHITVSLSDNASTDSSAEWVQSRFPRRRCRLNAQNIGYGPAHNALLHVVPKADYYLPLDPDVLLDMTYIAALVMALETYGGGWATGKLLLCDDPSQLYSAGRAMGRSGSAFNIGHAMPDAAEFGLPREVFGAPCAAPLISRAMIGDVVHDGNLFDPLLSLSGEDSDLMWRARRLGWACWYVPNAVASHLGSAQSVSLRVEALSNRWLSCVKNAYPVDLVTLHAPQISLSLVARLILTPRTGFQLARRFFSHVRPAWRNRRPARIPRRELAGWWRWSARQPSLQSRSLSARLSDFLTRRFRL